MSSDQLWGQCWLPGIICDGWPRYADKGYVYYLTRQRQLCARQRVKSFFGILYLVYI